ncbi:MAG: FecR family protein [Chitinophagaceae bacterium]|nr:FecR family protein [Chitinophagaceae bacterium]
MTNNNSSNMEPDKTSRIAYLVAGYIRGILTDAEKDELDDWITQSDANMELFAELTDENNMEVALEERGSYNSEAAIARLKEKIILEKPTARRRTIRLMYAVAAAVSILLVLFFAYRYNHAGEPAKMIAAAQDVQPGTDKAVLTIAGGKQIALDSSVKGNVFTQDGLQVSGSGAMLQYSGKAATKEWHTLTTPRGGQYKLQLPDGTLVWLNAESSITFPSLFDAGERRIKVTGEVYLEVAKDASKKFTVIAGRTATEVFGTHFNINAYDEGSVIYVTLEEGSVKVKDTTNNSNILLKPGTQAIWKNEAFTIHEEVNMEEMLAWKNGWFYFKEAPIEDIMQQASRWYNVDVRYEGKINYHFNADIERNVSVSKLLELLQATGRVHFNIQDKTIIVKP